MEEESQAEKSVESTVEKVDSGKESGFVPPASQEDLDRIIGERLKRERSKYADYDALKAQAEKADEVAKQLADAQARIQHFEVEAERAKWVSETAAEFGVPAEVLRGDSLDELKLHAAAVKEALKPGNVYLPTVGDEPIKSKNSAVAFAEHEMFSQR